MKLSKFGPILLFSLSVLGFSLDVSAAEKPAEKLGTVRYKSGKEVRFDEVLIKGQLQRPEVLVVTGDSGQSSDGLLRLREDFLDHITQDFGENIQ
jgi:hypothetical protein